jgi:hypothetical protein
MESVVCFARSLPPVKSQIARIRTKYRPDDVQEAERQIRHLVRDIGKKLQATMDRRTAERAEDAEDADEGPDRQSKLSSSSTVRFPIVGLVLTISFSGSIRLGFTFLPKGRKAPHRSSDRRP